MRNMKRFLPHSPLASLAAGATLVMSANALAAPFNEYNPHIYVGGYYGGFKARGGDFDDENDYWEGVLGIKFNRYIGLEGSYSDFGEYGDNDIASAEVDGYGIALLGSIPLTETFDVYAKVGQFFSDVDVEFLGVNDNFEDDHVFYGLGVNFYVTEPLSVSVEYNRYKLEMEDADFPLDFDASDNDMDTLKVGAKYRF